MKKPTLAQQVATLDALLTAERAAHAETRKQIAEALVVDPDGALEARDEEIRELRTEIAQWEKKVDELTADKDKAEADLSDVESKLSDAQDTIDYGESFEPKFLVALEMLGMTEHEFEWSKRASDCLMRMPELADVGHV